MTFNTFVDLLAQHWVLLALVLCPIVVVMMALAALTCEACGAPFGIFRRRSKTIDLCLRCAVLHDIRRAKDAREGNSGGRLKQPAASGDSDVRMRSSDEPLPAERRESESDDRRYLSSAQAMINAASQSNIR